MTNNVLGIIMAGGSGTRLWPLTENRAKPAVPVAGKFRLIDIPISNCINSNIRNIFVLTQFNSLSLSRHITRTYSFAPFSEGFVQILAAEQTPFNKDWYQGTADSVRKNLHNFTGKNFDYHLILAGDHLYSMDYQELIDFHKSMKADITIGVLPVSQSQSQDFGILKLDDKGWISDFIEKPQTIEASSPYKAPPQWLQAQGFDPEKTPYIGSMGIYVFSSQVLVDMLTECAHADFGKGVIPYAIKKCKVAGYLFKGFWEDVGTIGAFYDMMMDLVSPVPKFNFYEASRPIYTHPRYLPGAKITGCHVCRSIVNEGAILEECHIEDAMIGIRSRIRRGARITQTVIMGADYYETEEDIQKSIKEGIPPVGIGKNCVIEKAIIDKNARIGDNVRILAGNRKSEVKTDNYVIREGIVVVPKNAVIPSGTVID